MDNQRFETTSYRLQYDPERERERGPDHDLEVYYSPSNQEIGLTTGEREDFESGDGFKLAADVLTQEEFDQLLDYAKRDCGAKAAF